MLSQYVLALSLMTIVSLSDLSHGTQLVRAFSGNPSFFSWLTQQPQTISQSGIDSLTWTLPCDFFGCRDILHLSASHVMSKEPVDVYWIGLNWNGVELNSQLDSHFQWLLASRMLRVICWCWNYSLPGGSKAKDRDDLELYLKPQTQVKLSLFNQHKPIDPKLAGSGSKVTANKDCGHFKPKHLTNVRLNQQCMLKILFFPLYIHC